MTVYADQMFFENFIMNVIILYATSKFSGIASSWYRLSIGALIGAGYVISSYIFGFYDEQLIIIKILLAGVMIVASFRIKSLKIFLKLFVFFFGITLFIGGAGFGLAFFTNAIMIHDGGVLYVEEFPILIISLGTVVSIILIKWICVFLKSKINLKDLLYNIEIKIFDKKIATTVLLDSGHNVKEPFTGYPVIIVEKNILNEIIPDEVMKKANENNFEFEEKWRRRMRLIPISTVSDKNDVLIGFKVDEGVIYRDSGNKTIKNLIVAGCVGKLDEKDSYFALMGNILD